MYIFSGVTLILIAITLNAFLFLACHKQHRLDPHLFLFIAIAESVAAIIVAVTYLIQHA